MHILVNILHNLIMLWLLGLRPPRRLPRLGVPALCLASSASFSGTRPLPRPPCRLPRLGVPALCLASSASLSGTASSRHTLVLRSLGLPARLCLKDRRPLLIKFRRSSDPRQAHSALGSASSALSSHSKPRRPARLHPRFPAQSASSAPLMAHQPRDNHRALRPSSAPSSSNSRHRASTLHTRLAYLHISASAIIFKGCDPQT